MKGQRKVTLFIAMSLDGYIAKPDGDISFLDSVAMEGEDYGYAEFVKTIDTVVWGRKTYDKVLGMDAISHYQDKQIYVLSNSLSGSNGNVTFFNNVAELFAKLQSAEGKGIYCDGGAELVSECMKNHLFDELIVSVIPVLLGDGIHLFKSGIPESKLKLIGSQQFASGLVQLRYQQI